MFFRSIFGLKPTNQKALRDEIYGSRSRRHSGPTSRKKAEPGGNDPGTPPPTVEIFQYFETPERRAGAFSVSLLLHIGLLLLLVVLPLVFTSSLKLNYDVMLVAPPLEKPQPPVETTYIPPPPPPEIRYPTRSPSAPLTEPAVVRSEPPRPREPQPERTDEIRIPKADKPERALSAPAPRIAGPEPASILPAPPKMPVQTGLFSKADGSSAAPDTIQRDVQTGGFGASSGQSMKNSTRAASVGGFGDSSGPPAKNSTRTASTGSITGGFGDSSGPPAKNSTQTASTGPTIGGFGDSSGPPARNSTRAGSIGPTNGAFSSATAPSGDRVSGGQTIRQSGFEPTQPAPSPSAPKKIDSGPPDKFAEIIFKPKPDYTEEARKLRVEGEVVVNVLFKASGEISVLDVVQGLGHGLDEAAVRAAQQIRFKPALRAGQAVDSTAKVHIIFQLAF
jgi:TonB family protein